MRKDITGAEISAINPQASELKDTVPKKMHLSQLISFQKMIGDPDIYI
jgi:hypothetical protein